MDLTFPDILTRLQSTHGKAFFDVITLELDKAISANHTYLAKFDTGNSTASTISIVSNGELAANFDYSLSGTPCENVSNDTLCIYKSDVCSHFPDDALLKDMKVNGYIGAPIHNSSGDVIGLVAGLYENEIPDPDFVLSLFRVFSGRIAAEMDSTERQKQLLELNETLEQKVEHRTQELSLVIDDLQKTQQKLLDKEKMAYLGSLVAGVAHELNTPLGVSLLGSSHIDEITQNISAKHEEGKLKRSELTKFVADIQEANKAVVSNLTRCAKLIENFKQMSVSETQDNKMIILLDEWLYVLSANLRSKIEEQGIELLLNVPGTPIKVSTYPSRLTHVISHLVFNASAHAFNQKHSDEKKRIEITLKAHHNHVTISISDNGVGLQGAEMDKVMQPFYTTKRGSKWTGLGLNIVKNLTTGALNGQMDLCSTPGHGLTINIELPVGDVSGELLRI